MDYITIATTGNATSFGNLTIGRYAVSATSNNTRGVCAGGYDNSTYKNVIDYITISTTGNATDFGDLTSLKCAVGSCSNGHGGLV
jgi:hypothetical protein